MAMNRQRRTANISNIFSYDDAGNIVIKDYGQVTRYSWNGLIHGFIGPVSVSSVSAATTDTDRFLVSDGGVLKYRTGVELLSDIGGVPSTRTLTINGTTYDLSADRSWTIAAGITGSGATGQVAYWNGTSTQAGSNNLFWDAANARLGIGTNAPASLYKLDVVGAIRASTFLWSPAFYAPSDLIFGISGGTAALRITTNRNTQIFDGTTPADGGQRLQVYGDAFIKGSGATSALVVENSAGTNMLNLLNNGSLLINTANNSNERLQVNGNVRIQGATSTSAIALKILNSSSQDLFRVSNQSIIQIGNGAGNAPQIYPTDINSSFNTTGFYLAFSCPFNSTATASPSAYQFIASFNPASSGESKLLNLTGEFTGNLSAVHNVLRLGYTINQAVGATGITRGLYINPTLTAAADWRSIEWSNNSGWGLYGAGTAQNYLGGALGIGATTLTGYNLRISRDISGATSFTSLFIDGVIQPGVTSVYGSFVSRPSTQTTTFNLSNLVHFNASAGSFSGGSTVTDQYGFLATADLTGATNNYGFFGSIPNGTNRWNLYMNGTADNYIRGKLLINTTTVGTFALDVNGTARVSGDLTILNNKLVVQNISNNTAPVMMSFINSGSGSGTGATFQFSYSSSLALIYGSGFVFTHNGSANTTSINSNGVSTLGSLNASSALTFTNSIPATIKSNGQASDSFTYIGGGSLLFQNYIGSYDTRFAILQSTGNVVIQNGGTFTDVASARLQVNSTTQGFLPPRMTTTQKNAIATPAAGLQVYDSTTNTPNYYDGTAWVAMGGGSGSGTYTPTVTVVSGGATSVTSNVARYIRVGNVVTVYGAFFYQPSGSGAVETNNQFSITLPITRTVTTNFASGTVSFSTVSGVGNQAQGYLYSTATTTIDLYAQNWWSGSGANAYYVFSYEIN